MSHRGLLIAGLASFLGGAGLVCWDITQNAGDLSWDPWWALLALVLFATAAALGRLALGVRRSRGGTGRSAGPSPYEIAGTIWLFVFPTILLGGSVLLLAWCSHVMRDA